MIVYHSSNVKIDKLQAGAYVTPDKEISKTFGASKPGTVHYLHKFEATVRDYPRISKNGRLFVDITAEPIGKLDSAETPDGEDWDNYVTVVELCPISVTEY